GREGALEGAAREGAALEGAAPAIGIVQSATRKRPTAARISFESRIPFISRVRGYRSNTSSIRRGSRLVRLAVKTRSHLALRYNSSDSEGRLIVPIQPSPVSRSTFPLRLRTGISSPSISVFTG